MKIIVHAKPAARETKVEKMPDGSFTVWVTEPPVKGQANFAIIGAIADFLNVPRYNIRIISGATSRQKVLEISE